MYYTAAQTNRLPQHRFSCLRVAQEATVLRITLARANRENRLSALMVNELAFALSYAQHTQEVQVVMIDALGETFCAGADYNVPTATEGESSLPPPSEEVLLGELLPSIYKPKVAVVNGIVADGGLMLLAGCTHVIASEQASFQLTEIKQGLFPIQLLGVLLPLMPARKLLDWCIRGYSLSAVEALQWGLITEHVPEADITAAAHKLCRELAVAPQAVQLGLEAYHHLLSTGNPHQHEYLMAMLLQQFAQPQARQGILEFRANG